MRFPLLPGWRGFIGYSHQIAEAGFGFVGAIAEDTRHPCIAAIAEDTRHLRIAATAEDKRHPLIPDVPTFKELGVNWVDGAYRGIGVPKSTSPEQRKRLSDLWMALNNDPEMKDLAAKSGFELVNVGLEQMDAFMKERTQLYTEGAARLGLGKK